MKKNVTLQNKNEIRTILGKDEVRLVRDACYDRGSTSRLIGFLNDLGHSFNPKSLEIGHFFGVVLVCCT